MGILTGALVAGVAGSAISASAQSDAASSAASAQTASSNAQIAAQERALAETRALLQPYVSAGDSALNSQLDLLGLGSGWGNVPYEKQQAAVDNIANDPLFQAQVRQGEEAMLQNASATGGLRGGNIQGALAQYRPQMLNQEIQQRMAQYGGLANLGQNAAAGVGNASQGAATNISNAYGQIGSAAAGNALAQGQATANMMGGITGNLSNYAMMQGLGLFGSPTSGTGISLAQGNALVSQGLL